MEAILPALWRPVDLGVTCVPLCLLCPLPMSSLLIFKLVNDPHPSSLAFKGLGFMAVNTFCKQPGLDICEQLDASRSSTQKLGPKT